MVVMGGSGQEIWMGK